MRFGSGIQEWLWILPAEEITEATCPLAIKPKGGGGLGPGHDRWGARTHRCGSESHGQRETA